MKWTDMNDETYKLIKRKYRLSEEVLATNGRGCLLVGRIFNDNDRRGYVLRTNIGGGMANVTKFIKKEDVLKSYQLSLTQ